MSGKQIKNVIKEHVDKLMALPGVVGVGEGRSQGKQCIVVFVQDGEADSVKDIPKMIEGYSIVINMGGAFHAFQRK